MVILADPVPLFDGYDFQAICKGLFSLETSILFSWTWTSPFSVYIYKSKPCPAEKHTDCGYTLKRNVRTVYNNPSTLEDKPIQDQSAYIQTSFLATGKMPGLFIYICKYLSIISLHDEASPRGKIRPLRKCWCVRLCQGTRVGWHHVGHLDRRVRNCWVG